MAQIESSKVVDPFGEVNVFTEPDGRIRIKATILMRPQVEGAQTGLAIDGSNSMNPHFGASGAVSSIFGSANNIVQPVARAMAKYLANFDTDGNTTVIYWACGIAGGEIQELGDMNADQAASYDFSLPTKPGTGTQLLPAVKYFTETKFPTAPWSIFVFITDGVIEDLEKVKQYSLQIGAEIAQGKRNFTKFVLIGLGGAAEEAEPQMEELDDLDYDGLKDKNGDDIDLWDHKMAKDMKKLEEIFAEVVSERMILAPSATINDSAGAPVKPKDRESYADGLPALLDFTMSPGSNSFTLNLPSGQSITQATT
jgi:hypothetical protein